MESASTVVSALGARSAVGACNLRARSSALLVQGLWRGCISASTVVSAEDARSAVGQESASTVVSAEDARSAGRARLCALLVQELWRGAYCEHSRERRKCKECESNK